MTDSISNSEADHWGKALNRLFDTLDLSEWQAIQMDDPVEWLYQLRDEEYQRRTGKWNMQQEHEL